MTEARPIKASTVPQTKNVFVVNLMNHAHDEMVQITGTKYHFDPGESKGGGVCTPRLIAAVSIRDAGGGVCSRVRASSFGGNGRAAKEGVWATSSLFAGCGIGAMAVAGGVEGTAGGGSSDGTDPALEDSSAAMGTGGNALEVTTWLFTAGVSIWINRFL